MKERNLSFILLSLPILVLLPSIDNFIYPFNSLYSDVAITHFPNALFIRHSLSEFAQFPLWSNSILSGYPLVANPLAGYLYPPNWLQYLLPLLLGINLEIILHMIFGAFGMYYFLRATGCEKLSALLGGFTFEMMPKLFAHYAAGHISLVFAVCWSPWLLFLEKKRQLGGGSWGFASPGIALGMILLADVRWAGYAGLLWLAYSVSNLVQRKTAQFPRANDPTGRLSTWLPDIFLVILQPVVGVFIAAPLILPFWEYLGLSTRRMMTLSDRMIYSLPPARLLGMVFPDIGTVAEFTIYTGSIAFVCFLLALVVNRVRKQNKFWLVILLTTMLISLGSYLPGISGILGIPGYDLLRVPSRFQFITGISFCVIIANTADWILKKGASEPGLEFQKSLPILFPIFFAIVVFGISLFWISEKRLVGFLWGAAAIFIAGIILYMGLARKISPLVFFVAIFGLSLIDLEGVNLTGIRVRTPTSVLAEGKELADFLAGQPGIFRTYSPSYSLPQQTSAAHSLEMADGIDPLQLLSYSDYMAQASGIPQNRYSVTLPTFKNNSPANDNRDFIPDASSLGLLNIKYIISSFEIQTSGLTRIINIDGTNIYENLNASPRAWMMDGIHTDLAPKIQTANIILYSPNKIVLNAKGPGTLVISEIFYPGWKVTIDGTAGDIRPYQNILRSVDLPPGEHSIEFNFSPFPFFAGISVSLMTILCLMIINKWRWSKFFE